MHATSKKGKNLRNPGKSICNVNHKVQLLHSLNRSSLHLVLSVSFHLCLIKKVASFAVEARVNCIKNGRGDPAIFLSNPCRLVSVSGFFCLQDKILLGFVSCDKGYIHRFGRKVSRLLNQDLVISRRSGKGIVAVSICKCA